jgi:hypothetical protein
VNQLINALPIERHRSFRSRPSRSALKNRPSRHNYFLSEVFVPAVLNDETILTGSVRLSGPRGSVRPASAPKKSSTRSNDPYWPGPFFRAPRKRSPGERPKNPQRAVTILTGGSDLRSRGRAAPSVRLEQHPTDPNAPEKVDVSGPNHK